MERMYKEPEIEILEYLLCEMVSTSMGGYDSPTTDAAPVGFSAEF